MAGTSPILMQMMHTQMRYMAQRQTVLSQNIANLDTPGYRAQDLKKLDFKRMADIEAHRLQLRATTPKHLEAIGAYATGPYRQDKIRDPFEITPVGNNVTLEEEMAKVSTTSEKFQTSSSLMKKYTGMLQTATTTR